MIEEGVPLSRFTTIGTGGPARAFARPESVDELRARRWRWARRARPAGARVGLGSNLLVADEGVDALVAQARRRAGRVEVDGRTHPAPAAARRTPSACTRARGAGLGGFEFACAIPGTTGGGVLDERGRLRRRLRVGARARARRRRRRARGGSTPTSSASRTAARTLEPGQVVAEVELRLEPRPERGDPRDRRRAAGAAEGRPADEQADVRQRLQEPAARADRGPDARGVRAASGHRDRRRADLAAARELHRERRRRALGGRDRADGGGAPARVRAVRRRARARGRLPRPARAARRSADAQERRPAAANDAQMARGTERSGSARGGRAVPAPPSGVAACRARCRAGARSSSGSRSSPPSCSPTPRPATTPMFASTDVEVRGAPPRLAARGRARPRAARRGRACSRSAAGQADDRLARDPAGRVGELRPRVPAHARDHRPHRAAGRRRSAAADARGSSPRRGRVLAPMTIGRLGPLPRIWIAEVDRRRGRRDPRRRAGAGGGARARARCAGSRFPARVRFVRASRHGADARPRVRRRAAARRPRPARA